MMKRAPLLKRLKRNKCIHWITQPFNFGATATILYLGTFIVEALVYGGSGKWVVDKELNSLGDFLAGLFAPVAFLWLIVTVFLQKQELSLTRNEMIEQRKATQKQANEAEAHKKFIEQQTNIMKQQAELAATTYAKDRKLQLFDRRMDVYEAIKAFTEKPFKELSGDKETNDFIHLYNKVMFLFAGDSEIITWMMRMHNIVTRVINEDDIVDVRREWEANINPDVFHLAFFRHLTIYE